MLMEFSDDLVTTIYLNSLHEGHRNLFRPFSVMSKKCSDLKICKMFSFCLRPLRLDGTNRWPTTTSSHKRLDRKRTIWSIPSLFTAYKNKLLIYIWPQRTERAIHFSAQSCLWNRKNENIDGTSGSWTNRPESSEMRYKLCSLTMVKDGRKIPSNLHIFFNKRRNPKRETFRVVCFAF